MVKQIDISRFIGGVIREFVYFEVDGCIEGESQCASVVCSLLDNVVGSRPNRDRYEEIRQVLQDYLSSGDGEILGVNDAVSKIESIIE